MIRSDYTAAIFAAFRTRNRVFARTDALHVGMPVAGGVP